MLFQLNDANISNDYQMTGRNCEDLLDLPYTSGGLRTKYCQTRVNKDTEGSYKVSGHMLFKSKKYLMIEQNTKEIKREISIIKLNNSNHHKAVIPRIMSMKTFKTRVVNLYLT